MSIPAFSIFSASSELLVTAGVLYGIWQSLRGRFPKVLLGVTLAFELCVNVAYMARRAGAADQSSELSTAMKLFFAFHGTLSLAMFIALAIVYFICLWDLSEGRQNWFLRHRVGTIVMVAFWMISVTSGEAIFAMSYLF